MLMLIESSLAFKEHDNYENKSYVTLLTRMI